MLARSIFAILFLLLVCGAALASTDNPAISEWFDKYSQIRREAKMSASDKALAFRLRSLKPDKTAASVASRMIEKYAKASTQMRDMQPPSETKALHDGYLQYFTTARQLFQDYVDAQNTVPFPQEALVQRKQALAELDRKNKALDSELRKQYGIPRL
jgi:hypothetical protein